MNNQGPAKDMEMLEMVADGWRDAAPNVTFAGFTLADYEAVVAVSRQDRTDRIDIDNSRRKNIVKRRTDDAAALAMREKVVLAIQGDPNFGPDSALWEMIGYKLKSEYKSGLTRKKKNPLEDEVRDSD